MPDTPYRCRSVRQVATYLGIATSLSGWPLVQAGLLDQLRDTVPAK